MPTYQYRCVQCGNELEVVQKFTDPALTECAECQGALRKVYNAVGVVFKGSGFYRNDSRADAKAKGNGHQPTEKSDRSEKGEKSEKAERSDKGAESKSAAPAASGADGSTSGTSSANSEKKSAAASSTAA